MKKIVIKSPEGHFGKILGYDDRKTEPVPPPSTVLGMLRNIYGDDIMDMDFSFGYRFRSGGTFRDGITIYKLGLKGLVKEKDVGGQKTLSNIQFKDYHHDCELSIYTDIDRDDISVGEILCMGRSNCVAKIELPIEEITLKEKTGQAFNTYTPFEVGTGTVERKTMNTTYNETFGSYDPQTALLRYNREVEIEGFEDEAEDGLIYMWRLEKGEVRQYDREKDFIKG